MRIKRKINTVPHYCIVTCSCPQMAGILSIIGTRAIWAEFMTPFQLCGTIRVPISRNNSLESEERDCLTVLAPASKFDGSFEMTCRCLFALRTKYKSIIITYRACIIWLYSNLPVPSLSTYWSLYSRLTGYFQFLQNHVPPFLGAFFSSCSFYLERCPPLVFHPVSSTTA